MRLKAWIFLFPISSRGQVIVHWLTNSCLVDLIDVTLACEGANTKLIDNVTVADVEDEDRVDNSLVHVWKRKFGHKAS